MNRYVKRSRQDPSGSRAGTVLMEFVMAFPIVLTLMLAIVQFAHLWIARQVVHYAAYSAARVALVTEIDEGFAEEAAVRICSAITLSESIQEYRRRDGAGGGVPWAFDAARRKTRTEMSFDDWNVTATVEHDFALVVPIVGQMLGWGLTLWDSPRGRRAYTLEGPDDTGDRHRFVDAIEYPHMILSGTVIMPKPYLTLVAADYQE